MAEVQDIELEEVSEFDAVESKIEQREQDLTQSEPEDDFPQQFKGKDAKEVAKYAAAIEKRLSKQGAELGEVRRLADELLRTQLEATKAKEPERKEVDFFENPQEAVRHLVENNPRVLAAEQYARQAQQEQAKAALAQAHPDIKEIVTDAKFAEWVKGSPIRVQLFNAAENYDINAAHELLSTYKALRGTQQRQVTQADTQARDTTLKAVAVDTGGSGESSKKVYRRSDLIRLKIRDPERYEAMSDDIYAAYAEGRVR